MPTYVYKFADSGETIEVQQAFTDATLTEYPHPSDGTVRTVKKVFMPVGVTFKGSGFYKTDSRGSSSKSSSTSSSTNGDSGGSTSTPSGDTSTSTSTTVTPSTTSSTTSSGSSTPSSSSGSVSTAT